MQDGSRFSRELGRWFVPLSASFEEQVTEQDIAIGGEVFQHTARRGMREEFGVEIDPARVHLISVLLQMDNLNLGTVVLVETAETLEEIRRAWSGPRQPSHAWEAEAIDGDGIDWATLSSLAQSGHWRRGQLHPTSSLRLALLARWLQDRSGANSSYGQNH